MNALKRVGALCRGTLGDPTRVSRTPVAPREPRRGFSFSKHAEARPLLATHSPSLARRLRAMPSERDDDASASASASASAGPPSSDAQHEASTADAPSTAPTLQRPATPPPLAPDPPPRGRRGWMRRLVRGGDGDDDEDREDREDRDVAPAAEDGAADASAPGGEIELREVVVRDAPPVEEEEEGKKPDDPSDAEEETSDASKHPSLATSLSSSARFCRICIEPVEDAQLESGDATHLGCACVSGFMHRDCAVAFVLAKRRGPPTASLRCEVCLEDMVYLDELAREMREIGRQRRRARAALVALNRAHGGGAAPDPNRTARTGGRTADGRGRSFSAAASGRDADARRRRGRRRSVRRRRPEARSAGVGQPEPARVDRVDRHAALGADFLGTIRRGSIRRRGVSRFFVLAPAEATEASFFFSLIGADARTHSPSRTFAARSSSSAAAFTGRRCTARRF